MLVGGLALAGAAPPPEVLSRPQSPDARAPASETAFLLTERDLIPEGIALDPRTWTFYLGSFRKAKILAWRIVSMLMNMLRALPSGGEVKAIGSSLP